jgi:hypothetical protein
VTAENGNGKTAAETKHSDEKTALRGKRSAQDGKKNQKPKNTSADLHPRRTKNLSGNKFHRRNKPAAEDSSEENQHTHSCKRECSTKKSRSDLAVHQIEMVKDSQLRSGCALN